MGTGFGLVGSMPDLKWDCLSGLASLLVGPGGVGPIQDRGSNVMRRTRPKGHAVEVPVQPSEASSTPTL